MIVAAIKDEDKELQLAIAKAEAVYNNARSLQQRHGQQHQTLFQTIVTELSPQKHKRRKKRQDASHNDHGYNHRNDGGGNDHRRDHDHGGHADGDDDDENDKFTKINNLITECERHLTHCKNLIHRMEIETRDMHMDERSKVRAILKQRANKIKSIKNEIKWLKAENASNDKSNQFHNNKNPRMEDMTENEIYDYAENIQNEDLRILDRVILEVDQTNTQAEEIAAKVQSQTDQIESIDQKLQAADTELQKAAIILRVMYRRMITDKVIWFMVGIVCICVFIVVLQGSGVI